MKKILENKKRYTGSYYPNRKECLEILGEYGTPEHVVRHAITVSDVATAIGVQLNKKGAKINLELVASAGCLHDIARVKSKHDEAGAEYLEALGLGEVADVIRNHTFHRIDNKGIDIDEEDLLCIADRMVLEDKFAGAERRLEYMMKKALLKFGEEKKQELEERAADFVKYIDELEEFIGVKIEDILPESVK